MDVELQQVMKEAASVLYDGSLRPEETYTFPLSYWALHTKLRQMKRTVQLGFELDIYQPDELAGMYWSVFSSDLHRPFDFSHRDTNLDDRYLEHLFQTHITHLERLKGFLHRRRMTGVGVIGDGVAAIKRTIIYVNLLLHEAKAGRAFASGLSWVSGKQLYSFHGKIFFLTLISTHW